MSMSTTSRMSNTGLAGEGVYQSLTFTEEREKSHKLYPDARTVSTHILRQIQNK